MEIVKILESTINTLNAIAGIEKLPTRLKLDYIESKGSRFGHNVIICDLYITNIPTTGRKTIITHKAYTVTPDEHSPLVVKEQLESAKKHVYGETLQMIVLHAFLGQERNMVQQAEWVRDMRDRIVQQDEWLRDMRDRQMAGEPKIEPREN